ncbi:MAG: tRNA (N6-isopentenyl adenosine(37)-C2)-methylthiotransferase MiaB [Planctomycetota bacterium]
MNKRHPQRDPRQVCFITFGCQMNKLDSELAAGRFHQLGITTTPDPDRAGTIVINTCSVRKHAEDRALSNLGRFQAAKRRSPRLVLALMGCLAQKEGKRLLDRFPYLDVVCGTRQFTELPRLVARARREGERLAATDETPVSIERKPGLRPDRFRAFVSIMRGCDSFCSYCVVPYVRGRETSRPPDEVEAEARRLVGDGCVEITLLGQNVDAYRHGGTDLAGLLERLDGVAGLERLRFVTSHPKDISPRLLEAVAGLPSACEHLHMPAQSGSDRVLRAMNRGYTAGRYRELVAAARETVPGVEIASDFIVGFPGETDTDFEATVSLVRDCGFNQCFIFKYSPRPGTRAAAMEDDVPTPVKKERNQALLAVQEAVGARRNRAKEGQTVEVLVEGPSKRDASRLSGRTRGNDIVVFPAPEESAPAAGERVAVRITDSTPLTLMGRLARPA